MPRDCIDVLSPTTAQVLYILDETEDNWFRGAKKNQLIMALESCKTEIPIMSPDDGDINYLVQPGEVVAQGSLLGRLYKRPEVSGT